MTLRGKGINYDVGFSDGSQGTRQTFIPDVVRREMQIIESGLHCNAVRVSGSDPRRLTVAGECALDAGLELWLSPFPYNLTAVELIPYISDCARRAERLRQRRDDVTLVLGCEVSLFCRGLLPGEDLKERLRNITAATPSRQLQAAFAALSNSLNQTLAEMLATARKHFGGRITYASAPWEPVHWDPFDLVAVDLYRDMHNAPHYRQQLRAYLALNKPVAITEFGCCTYRGAADAGGFGFTIVDYDANPLRLRGAHERSEVEQANYLRDLLQVFDEEGVDSAFWFTFAGYELPHRDDPAEDLDMGSFGLVKLIKESESLIYPRLPWEPKQAFCALADTYKGGMSRGLLAGRDRP